jgi:uncharacterized protein YhfF
METLPSVEFLVLRLAEQGITLPPGPVRVERYGDSADLVRELTALIGSGRKRAGTGLLWAYEYDGETVAKAGDIEIVVNELGNPAVVTRILSTQVIAFSEVTAAYAAMEGESDGSLEYWRKGHWDFFTRECTRIGREPTQSMPVVCITFKVLNRLP